MRMGERVKVGVATATLAPGRTGYTDIQLECVQFRMPPKYPAPKDSAGAVAYYHYQPTINHHYHPSLRQTPTSRISACVFI